MSDERTEELASLYALGLLDADEARSFEDEMARDPELARLVERLQNAAAALAQNVPPREPPAYLKERILAEISASKKIVPFPKKQNVWLPWALAACLAVVASLLALERTHLKKQLRDLVANLSSAQHDSAELRQQIASAKTGNETLQKRVAFAQNEIEALRKRDALSQIKIATLTSLLENAPKAVAVVAWNETTQRGILKVANMPAPRADQDYQLWVIDPKYKQPVNAGVFPVAEGASRTEFHPDQPISSAEQFAVSLERKGGAPQHEGPIVMAGK